MTCMAGWLGKDCMRSGGPVMLHSQQWRTTSMFNVLSRHKPSVFSRMASLKHQRHNVLGKAQIFKMPFVPQINGRLPYSSQQGFGEKTGIPPQTWSFLSGWPKHELQLFLAVVQSGKPCGKWVRPCGKDSLPIFQAKPFHQISFSHAFKQTLKLHLEKNKKLY